MDKIEDINEIETKLNNEYIEIIEIEKLKENILRLIAENDQLRNENKLLKLELEKCSQIKMNVGKKINLIMNRYRKLK